MTKKKAVKKKTAKKKASLATPKVVFRSDDQLKQAEAYLGDATRTLPLPQSFFITSIFGLIISGILTVSGRISPTWGFAFCLVFVMMFISSFVTIHPREQYHN